MKSDAWRNVEIVPSEEQTPEQMADLAAINEIIGGVTTLVNHYLKSRGSPFAVVSLDFARVSEADVQRHWWVCQCTSSGDSCKWVNNH